MKKVSQREVLEILRRLGVLERENPELFAKIMCEERSNLSGSNPVVEEKTRCRCEP